MSSISTSTQRHLCTVDVQPLERESFLSYGDVIDVGSQAISDIANQGTARRFNHLTSFVNMRALSSDVLTNTNNHQQLSASLTQPAATPNLCIFRVQPASQPFYIKLLERHKYSTQMFIPMVQQTTLSNATTAAVIPSYYVIAALNDPTTQLPDWSTLRVFHATTIQAFNYRAGVWHHPMVGLGGVIDFVCLVWERRESQTEENEDTEEAHLDHTKHIEIRFKMDA
ncbi:hypothetical protein BASA50_007060 [Batrachochytrium salamandrivorans]|uniref:Ureidoglycolate hydrolase n=1 Tax=Batrachochytrium salamandrivorans TaxID=1357716 RepID=A0ABQ8F8I2_9FUNG|nr:hypothetical protein BASA60_006616 [Batrachochytrium salamandrivorans]KAH6593834.1 hypothetical protein BASA50_007060 [Batrachochytrium salamandrivorans]KAJ1341977.1 hypothetical protein BSLG_003477 [Batrachochytrium salamandrivorans]